MACRTFILTDEGSAPHIRNADTIRKIMPKKPTSQYVCQQCGAVHTKWAGRCDNCGSWNSLVEQAAQTGTNAVSTSQGKKLTTQPITEVMPSSAKGRIGTGIPDIDLVLGGGIVPASVVLIAGQPGIGKSTVLMQLANEVSKTRKVLYVSGEESAGQVKVRADRLGAEHENLHLASSTSADDIAATIATNEYELVVVD